MKCPSCQVELKVTSEVREVRRYYEVVKESRREESWVGKRRSEFKLGQ